MTVDVSPKEKQFSVSLQDDRIDTKSTETLELPDFVKGPFSAIQLRHSGEVPGLWIEYDALWRYDRKAGTSGGKSVKQPFTKSGANYSLEIFAR